MVKNLLRSLRPVADDDLDSDDDNAETRLSPLARLQVHIRKIRTNPQQRKQFLKICGRCNLPALIPIIYVDTRWNATHDMLNGVIEYRQVFLEHAKHSSLRHLTLSDDEWEALEAVAHLLEPFKTVSTLADTKSYVNISTSVDFSLFLKHVLRTEKDIHRGFNIPYDAALEKLKVYHDKLGIVGAMCTLLDPRLNHTYLQKHCQPDWVEHVLKSAFDIYTANVEKAKAKNDEDSDKPPPTKKPMYDFDEWLSRRKKIATMTMNEMQCYLALPQMARSTRSLEWWKRNESSYPIVSKMARDYLAIPATSVPSGRIINDGADLVSPNRARLDAQSIRMATCVKSWLCNDVESSEGIDYNSRS